MKKYLVSASLLLSVIVLFVCFGAGACNEAGTLFYSIYELAFTSHNTGSLIGFIFLVAGIVFNAIVCALLWFKEENKLSQVLSLMGAAFFYVSGIFFALVETFSSLNVYMASVFSCIMALISMVLMIVSGSKLIMVEPKEETPKKKYRY